LDQIKYKTFGIFVVCSKILEFNLVKSILSRKNRYQQCNISIKVAVYVCINFIVAFQFMLVIL